MRNPFRFDALTWSEGLNTSLRHAGKVQLLVEIQQKYRDAGDTKSCVWVRWHERPAPATLEDQLIKYLNPAYNSAARTVGDGDS